MKYLINFIILSSLIFSASIDLEYLFDLDTQYPDITQKVQQWYVENDGDLEGSLIYYYNEISTLETLEVSQDEFVSQTVAIINDTTNSGMSNDII